MILFNLSMFSWPGFQLPAWDGVDATVKIVE
jgi:hypothetical protein